MNILISTTTNWNCGDEFIRIGVKNILKHIYPKANYIHYDRNPNNMIDYPSDQNIKTGLHGAFMNNPIDWSIVDLVVLAGSPEFLHEPLMPIYEGLADNIQIPLWVIGVGYSYPEFIKPLSLNEKTVLSRNNTIIISRQEELSNRLSLKLNKHIYTLPCPALFCFENFPVKTNKDYNGVHSIEELKDGLFFSSDPYDMLYYIGSCEKVVSDRLHAVVAGISSGAYSKLQNDTFRCVEAIKLFSCVLESNKSKIEKFKIETFNNYIKIIKNETLKK